MPGRPLCSVASLTGCSSLQLLHVCPSRLLHVYCTCQRHEERLREGGKEEVHGQPCSHLCDQVPHVRTCIRTSSVQCGITHKLVTGCSSLQLLHACPPTLPHARCTCKRHEERLGEGGKEEVHVQPCSQLCDQMAHVRNCVWRPPEQCGITHRLQLPPTAPCTSAKATPCSLYLSDTRREAEGGWEEGGPWAAMLTSCAPTCHM